ncbi:HNH endonuclease signature motif containing protein [Acidovorax sp. SUPP3334]|uniref:HNH endonuclease signature motif containing protein n=1 Tax=Acidovorax sp. SUPP3334 TaxID=2920881 RepID=UPI0023DE36DC|nr:HNH endonuclease signature motif containing protein [Acidovorax sp. SUPP3334]GKT22542.1 HNH endonuclease [Acidovorax sp. SUPP3334]
MTKSQDILPPRRAWTPHEVRRLRELYPDLLASTLARELGRPVEAVYRKAHQLGLCKSDAFMASDMSRRINRGHQLPSMVASRFQPGSRPWNKGVKGVTGTHPNTRATQFKKGQLRGAARHNYVPIGSERICADGYLERKMTDDPSIYPARRWVAVHRLVWIKAHGAIPAGHIVVFRPGKKTVKSQEITVDRLECITRAENARRNHPRNKSPELARLVQLKGAITRQVNRIARESGEGAKA